MNKDRLFRYYFGCDPAEIKGTLILTPVIPLKKFADNSEVKKSFKGQLYSGIVISGKDEEFTVIHCGIGDRLTGDAVLLLERTSSREIIFTGTCGGFHSCGIGDIILSEKAFNGEGFTRYYSGKDIQEILSSGEDIPAHPEYMSELKNVLVPGVAGGRNVIEGNIFTVGSLLAETPELLKAIEEKGYAGIEMELSAVYSAARAIGAKAVGLLTVSDTPKSKPLGEALTGSEKDAKISGINCMIESAKRFASNKIPKL
jgi:purine-nucleoside phosphorylase